jgi:hypothetical protein
MNINTVSIWGRWTSFFGVMLVLALMVPAVAFSQMPEKPLLDLPLDVAGNVSTVPTLSWNIAANADTYNLQVSLNSDCSTPLYTGTLIAGLNQELPVVLSNFTQYYWRVSATNGTGTSDWSIIWSFTTNPTPVDLGAAGTFRILAQTGITGGAACHITGDIGVSPSGAGSITGFGLLIDGGGTFSTSTSVTNGKVYASNYTEPTPTNLTASISAKNSAYGDAAGRLPVPTGIVFSERGSGEIGGLTLVPGLYKWSSAVTISNDVTLSGAANDVWIFQITGTLGISANKQVLLGGSALASNIFWQVSGQVTLETSAAMKGIILGATGIAFGTSATLDGRAFAGSNVTLDGNTLLPVELVSFTAKANRMNADLRWSTATEVNNYGFEIERRQTADWKKVGFVTGAGTSNSPRNYSYTDNALTPGVYAYRLKQVDNNGTFSYHSSIEVAIAGTAPTEFALMQNYPNPFNPSTQIQYSLGTAAQVSLKIYNLLGLEVATLVNGRQAAGSYSVPFTATGTASLSSGVYFCRLEAGSFVSTKRLILLK